MRLPSSTITALTLSAVLLGACSSSTQPDTGMPAADGSANADATPHQDAQSTLDAAPEADAAADAGISSGDASSGDTISPKSNCDAPTQLDTASVYAIEGRIVSNNHGTLVAAWLESDTGTTAARPHAVRVFSAGAWAPPLPFGPSASRPADLGIDGAGNALAYWIAGNSFDGYRNRYDAQLSSWSAAEDYLPAHGDPGGDDWIRRLAVNEAGAAIFAFTNNAVRAARFDPGPKTWTALEMVEATTASAATSPAVAIDASGRPAVVWLSSGQSAMGHQAYLRASAYRNGAWTPAAAILKGQVDTRVVVKALPSGDVLVLGADSESVQLWRYSPAAAPGSEWGAPEVLAPAGSAPRLLVDADGNITAAWLVGSDLHLRRKLGAGFGPDVDLGPSRTPAIALDGDGNVSALLNHAPLMLRRVAKLGTAWTDPVSVAPNATDPGSGDPFGADVVHDGNGNPVILFDAVAAGNRHQFTTTCR